jgi:hypothetical protein
MASNGLATPGMEVNMSWVASRRRKSPFFALARGLTRAAGPAALLRAVPPFAALGLLSTILFAGNGMRARDLVAVLDASLAARACLWAAWLLVTAPAARALVEAPSTFFFRTLPAPLWHFWLVHGAHLLALQAPWILLYGRGAGLLAGVVAGLSAAAASALSVARPRTPLELSAAAALLAAIALPAPLPLMLGIALGAGSIGVAAAFVRAPERGARRGASVVFGSAPVALALAHAAVLARRDAMSLVRGGSVALVGSTVFALAVRNNGITERAEHEAVAIACGAIPLSLATGGVAVKILETERLLTWLLLTTATSARCRALTAASVTVAWSAAVGALYGSVGAFAAGVGGLAGARLGLLGVALGAALGATAAWLARRAEQPLGVDGTSVVVGMTAAAVVTMLLATSLGGRALVPCAAAAALLGAWTERALAYRERRSDAIAIRSREEL